MKKSELVAKTGLLKNETRDALQQVVDELNNGQRKKLLKNEKIKALLDRYEVQYE